MSLVVAAGPGARPAGADSITDKRRQAEQIATKRAQLTAEAERLNEQANKAEDDLAALDAELARTQSRLDAQQANADALRQQAIDLALSTYMNGDLTNGLGSLVSDNGATDLQLRRGYAPLVAGDATDVRDAARAAAQDTAAMAHQLDARKTEQQRLKSYIAQRRTAIANSEKQLTALAAQVDGELAALVAADEARKAAEAEAAAAARQRAEEERAQRAADKAAADKAAADKAAADKAAADADKARAANEAAARVTAAPSPSTKPSATGASTKPTTAPKATSNAPATPRPGATSPVSRPGASVSPSPAPAEDAPDPAPSNVPPPSPAAAAAVAEALRQLGKPYVFGANGPDTFDCSGLTQWAWAKAGVAMAHYTVSQFHAFPHVPLNQLAPGDLVFFNLNLGHVGMYIGNGQYIQAPRTHDVVKISNLAGRNVVGAVRPG